MSVNLKSKLMSQLKSFMDNKQTTQVQNNSMSMSDGESDVIQGERLFDEASDQVSNKKQTKQKEEESQEDESDEIQESESGEQNMEDKLRSILKSKVQEVLHSKNDKNKDKKKVSFVISNQRKEKNPSERIFTGMRKWNEKIQNSRKGKFDPLEERTLLKALNECIIQMKLSFESVVESLSEEEQKIPRNLQLWTKVCSVLPDRSLVNSFKFLKRLLCQKNNSGPWTDTQTDMLLSHIERYGRKWSLIAKKMNRTAENIRDKYRTIGEQNNEEIQKQLWTLQELIKFLKLLQKYSHKNFLNQEINKELEKADKHNEVERAQMLKKRYNSKSFTFHNNEIVRSYMNQNYNSIKMEDINWKKISDKIITKTIFDCRNKFVQLLQIQIKGMALSKEKVEKQMVKFVIEQRVKQQNQINWKKWGQKFDISSEQAKNRWMILKRHIQGRGRKQFKELLQQMKEKTY